MTDLEKLRELIEEFVIGYEEKRDDSECIIRFKTSFKLEKQEKKKVYGYTGFFCNFVFDSEGKFKSVGVWE